MDLQVMYVNARGKRYKYRALCNDKPEGLIQRLEESEEGDRQIRCLQHNPSQPSEHPPSGAKMSKGLGGNIGCRDKAFSWYQTGSPM